MIERRIVRRYASALYNAAAASDVVDRVESDLGLISYALETAPDLLEAVQSPLVPVEAKREIVRDVFADKVHEITLSFLDLLIEKRREEALLFAEEEYLQVANEARGIVDAHMVSAVRTTEEEESLIRARLMELTGRSVNLVRSVDPELIGGVVVRVGDTVIDGSVRGQLAALRERLLS